MSIQEGSAVLPSHNCAYVCVRQAAGPGPRFELRASIDVAGRSAVHWLREISMMSYQT